MMIVVAIAIQSVQIVLSNNALHASANRLRLTAIMSGGKQINKMNPNVDVIFKKSQKVAGRIGEIEKGLS